MDLRREADQVGQLAHRVEVACGGQLLEPERIEVVAGQEPEVAVGAHDQARLLVMEKVALPNRLDEHRVLLRGIARPGTGRRQRAERGLVVRVPHVRPDHVLTVAEKRRQSAEGG
jgi:hypothetical protein